MFHAMQPRCTPDRFVGCVWAFLYVPTRSGYRLSSTPLRSIHSDQLEKGGMANSRLWSESDLSQLVKLLGVIVDDVVKRFGKITGDLDLGPSLREIPRDCKR